MNIESLEQRVLCSVFHVATNGSDSSSSDGSILEPWRTLKHAANKVVAGDTVNVGAGNFVGFNTSRDGTAAKPITFKSVSGTRINSPGNSSDGINLEGASYWIIDGFTINNMPRSGIRSVTNQGVQLLNNKLDSNGRWGIFTGFSQNVLIERNIVSRSKSEHGIYVSNSSDNPIIKYNTSFSNNACGIQINADGSQGGDGVITGALIEGNILYDNGIGRGGATINLDGVQNSKIVNNILYKNNNNNGIALFRIDGSQASKNNTVINNTIIVTRGAAVHINNNSTGNKVFNNIMLGKSYDISNGSKSGFVTDYNIVTSKYSAQDSHSFSSISSELFVSASANDYHLRINSPAINKGTSNNAPNIDFEKDTRIGGIDIGADERKAA